MVIVGSRRGLGAVVASIAAAAVAGIIPGDSATFRLRQEDRELDAAADGRRWGKRAGGGKRHAPRYKGSSAAKRGARLAQKRAKAANRPRLAAKRQDAIAAGLVRDLVARQRAGFPVTMRESDMRELGWGRAYGVQVRVLDRLGPAYTWRMVPNGHVYQLQGPPAPILPAPFVRRTRSA